MPTRYLVIILPGSLFTMIAIAVNNLLMAEGRPGTATVVLAGGAVLNVILDALFILALGWGVTGAAAATVTAQGGAVFSPLVLPVGRSALRVSVDALIPRWELIREIAALGIPIFIIESARSVVVVVINNILSQYPGGDAYIALFGVINAVLEFALAPFIGAALAYLPLAAYNYGAGNYHRVRQAIWQSCLGADGWRRDHGGRPHTHFRLHRHLLLHPRGPPGRVRRRASDCSFGPAHRGHRVRQFHRLSGPGHGVAVGRADHDPARRAAAGLGVRTVPRLRHLGRLVVLPGPPTWERCCSASRPSSSCGNAWTTGAGTPPAAAFDIPGSRQ